MFVRCPCVAVAVPIGRLSYRNWRKPYIRFACGMMGVVYFAFAFAPPLAWILILGFVYGAGNGAFLTVDYALAVDTLPDKDSAARDLGLWGVSAFIGSAGGPIVLGPLLHVAGILSLGGWWAEIVGKPTASAGVDPDLDVRYGLKGYQAILAAGMLFVAATAYMLKYVSTR